MHRCTHADVDTAGIPVRTYESADRSGSIGYNPEEAETLHGTIILPMKENKIYYANCFPF